VPNGVFGVDVNWFPKYFQDLSYVDPLPTEVILFPTDELGPKEWWFKHWKPIEVNQEVKAQADS
jgi:hypothetical protein